MPTYAYECPTCGEQSEVVQKMSDPTLTDCPACGAPGVRKLFHNVGVVFKGSGFYRTDSRGKKSAATPGSTTTSSGSSTPAASAPTTTPAAAPAAAPAAKPAAST